MVHNPLHCFPLYSRLHRQQYSPTPNCFKQTILPPLWYPSMDWRICPLPFRSWWRWSLCNMLQMQHIPFPILFLWSNCLQLHSRNLCPQARSCLVYQPFDDLQIPVSFFPNRLSISPLYPFFSPHLSPAWSLWNVWSLASSLSNNTTLSFQWVPGHAGLPGNEKADLLAKTGASLPTDAIPSPLLPVIAKVRYSQYRNWRRHISHSLLNFQVPEVSSEELLLSRSIRSELSRLRCHGHSLLLSSYLHRISRKENSDCSACGHLLQDLNHLLLDCPASEPFANLSLAPLFLFSIYGPDLGVWPDCWVSAEFLRAPIPRKGSGSTTTTTRGSGPLNSIFAHQFKCIALFTWLCVFAWIKNKIKEYSFTSSLVFRSLGPWISATECTG